MYCFAVVTDIKCVINELYMWTDISSEHPIFLKTVAELTDKNLTDEMVLRLDDLREKFMDLNIRVKNSVNYMYPTSRRRAIDLCKQFIQLDREALRLYNELANIDPEDKIWQTLIEHIIHEQKYMYRLFNMLLYQIQGNGC